jgi:hypothetical protein
VVIVSAAGFSVSANERITFCDCSEFLDRISIVDFLSPQFRGASISFLDLTSSPASFPS